MRHTRQAEPAFAIAHSGPGSVRRERAGEDRADVDIPERDGLTRVSEKRTFTDAENRRTSESHRQFGG